MKMGGGEVCVCFPRSLKVEAPRQDLWGCLWFLLTSACSGPEEHTAHLVPSLGHPGRLLLFGCRQEGQVLASPSPQPPSWAPGTRKCQSHLLMELLLLMVPCKGCNLGREGYSSILSFFSFPWCLGDLNLAVLNPAIIYCNFFCLLLFLLLKVLLFSLLSTGILFPLIGGKRLVWKTGEELIEECLFPLDSLKPRQHQNPKIWGSIEERIRKTDLWLKFIYFQIIVLLSRNLWMMWANTLKM